MRHGIFSDVHGNHFALRAVLDALDRLEVDSLLCAGDLVGYGPHPNECVETIASRDIACVAGNHDLIALGRLSDVRCVQLAKDSQRWTRSVLTSDSLRHLESLPPLVEIGPLVMTHGAIGDPQEYTVTSAHAARQLDVLARAHPEATTLVLGHTHRQWAFDAGRGAFTPARGRAVLSGPRCMINPGSVGQSRQWERRPRARFMVLDLDTRSVEFHAVTYDVDGCVDALAEIGFPREAIHDRPGMKNLYFRTRRRIRDRTGLRSPRRPRSP